MTERLEQAIARLQTLPEGEQNVMALIIFEELEAEKRWDELFSQSRDFWRNWPLRRWLNTRWVKLKLLT